MTNQTVITPVVEVNSSYSFYYPCDSKSVIRRFGASGNFTGLITCFGTIISTTDSSYDVIIGKPGDLGKSITLKLTNFTFLQTFVNG